MIGGARCDANMEHLSRSVPCVFHKLGDKRPGRAGSLINDGGCHDTIPRSKVVQRYYRRDCSAHPPLLIFGISRFFSPRTLGGRAAVPMLTVEIVGERWNASVAVIGECSLRDCLASGILARLGTLLRSRLR